MRLARSYLVRLFHSLPFSGLRRRTLTPFAPKGSTAAREITDEQTKNGLRSVSDVTEAERAARFGQKAATILFTGLTGTGKSTIARAVERALFDDGRAVAVLDGELMRRGVNMDLGYTVEDRSENLRRSAHVAKLINEKGLICLGAFVAPSQTVRERVADVIGKDRFITVHCTASESVCRQRDTKGHYAAAEAGKLPNFPGVSAVYEPPENPDLVLDTGDLSIEECVSAVLELLKANQIIR